MTDSEQMTLLKSMTDETDEDLLSAALDYAGQAVLNQAYPYGGAPSEVPTRYMGNQLDIAAYLLNKRGADGQLSVNENGIYRTFEAAAIPASMFKGIVPYVGSWE